MGRGTMWVYIPGEEVGEAGGPWMTGGSTGMRITPTRIEVNDEPIPGQQPTVFVRSDDDYWMLEPYEEVLGAGKWHTLIIEADDLD